MTPRETRLLSLLLAARIAQSEAEYKWGSPFENAQAKVSIHEAQSILAEIIHEAEMDNEVQSFDIRRVMQTCFPERDVDAYQATHQRAWDAFHDDVRWAMRGTKAPPMLPIRRTRQPKPASKYGLPDYMLNIPMELPDPAAPPPPLIDLS